MDYTSQAEQLAERYGVTLSIADQPGQFLAAVWAVLPDQGVIGLVSDDKYLKGGALVGTTISDWYFANDRANYNPMTWATYYNDDPGMLAKNAGNIYWNGASRTQDVLGGNPAKNRGTKAQLIAAGSLWCDLDLIKSGTPLETGVNALLALPLPPSIIIFSGGGLQAVHLLAEPWIFDTPAEATLYRQHSQAFYRDILSNPVNDPDPSVHEAARMMRLPGFHNNKKGRDRAIARIIYWRPDVRYTLDQIIAVSPLPIRHNSGITPVKPPEDGLYAVKREFIDHMIKGEVPAVRHHMMRYLAQIAAQGGIPRDVFEPLLYQRATEWYADDLGRLGEVPQVCDWGYGSDVSDWEPGTYLVKATESGFVEVADAEFDQLRDRTVVIDFAQRSEGEYVSELRAGQDERIDHYLAAPTRRIGTMLWLGTPPGIGKTYQTLQHARQWATQHYNPDQGSVLYLSQFKIGWQDGRTWAESNHLDPDSVGFFIARNDDKTSPGYCKYTELAQRLGGRGYNVQRALCQKCPLFTSGGCESKHYLAQFGALRRYPILVARFQHGYMDQITQGRSLIVIDESPLEMVGRRITVDTDHVELKDYNPFLKDQYPAEVQLLGEFTVVLRQVMIGNFKRQGAYTTWENVRLGGYWLMNQLYQSLGRERFEAILRIPDDILAELHPVDGLTMEQLEDIAPEFLRELLAILSYEYRTHYRAGSPVWNSRVIPYNYDLHIYPMTPLQFPAKTKVIICDATGHPDLYPRALTDNHTESLRDENGAVIYQQGKNGKAEPIKIPAPRPRQMSRFAFPVRKPEDTRIIQWAESDFSRTTVFNGYKAVKETPIPDPKNAIRTVAGDLVQGTYTLEETQELARTIRENGNPALSQLITLTHWLVQQYGKNLLIVTYKTMIEGELSFYAQWIKKSGILPPENLQWFQNLRGRNNWKHYPAVLVIGTPRIPEMDLASMAQVWNWQNPIPLDYSRMERIEPYRGYQIPDGPDQGKGLGYRYRGYKDPELNSLYLWTVQSELEQCATRIRPNTEAGPKTVLIATGFPFAAQVTQVIKWGFVLGRLAAHHVLAAHMDQDMDKTDLYPEVAALVGCSLRTAQKYLDTELADGCYLLTGQRWTGEGGILRETVGPKNKKRLETNAAETGPAAPVDTRQNWGNTVI